MIVEYETEHVPFEKRTKCTLCDSPATAMWQGRETIYICSQCALESLPALIADSIWISPRGIHAHSFVDSILVSFWRALALRLNVSLKNALRRVEHVEVENDGDA
jgi:hypothetical protein